MSFPDRGSRLRNTVRSGLSENKSAESDDSSGADNDDDPFADQIRRSGISQTIKAARASLKVPKRPFTPGDRSLFSLDKTVTSSRPSSSYSISGKQCVVDTFGGERKNLLTNSIAENEIFRESSSKGQIDVLTLNNKNGFSYVREYHDERSNIKSNESVSSSGDDLTPTSIRSSGGRPASAHSRRQANQTLDSEPSSCHPIGAPSSLARPATAESAKPPSAVRRSQKARLKSPDVSESDDGETDVNVKELKSLNSELERLAKVITSDKRNETDDLGQFDGLSARVNQSVEDISQREEFSPRLTKQIERLLRVLLLLAGELKHIPLVIRWCKYLLNLLMMVSSFLTSISPQGLQAGLLNVAKILFKHSKNSSNDDLFRKEGLLPLLLNIATSDHPQFSSNNHARVFIVGVLKNSTANTKNQKELMSHDAINHLADVICLDRLSGISKESQVLIQVIGCLRNFADDEERHSSFKRTIPSLIKLLSLYTNVPELLVNVSRLLSKISLNDDCLNALLDEEGVFVRQIANVMSANQCIPSLILRLAFVLGNLAALSDKARVRFFFDCEGLSILASLFNRYIIISRKGQEQSANSMETPSDEPTRDARIPEYEDVLVKLVRLVANCSITTSIGTLAASSSAIVDPLLEILEAKNMEENEELVLNTVAALTNLLYYDTPSSLLFTKENKLLLCQLFRPLLYQLDNTEALLETTRALGNLSRHADVRSMLIKLALVPVLVELLEHPHRDSIYYITGVLINMSSDVSCTTELMTVGSSGGVAPRMCEIINEASKDEDWDLVCLALKLMINICRNPKINWEPKKLKAVRKNVMKVIESAGVVLDDGDEDDDDEITLELKSLRLARHLMSCLPEIIFSCPFEVCGRKFSDDEALTKHLIRRHPDEWTNE
eukprot:GHVL01010794.1.p1 GENE.GHVL01010794.1~~GHVL01010794.1.p1  ORF type:complete len:898 (+),score=144.27 GHVL01010794.1:10-2703(+)